MWTNIYICVAFITVSVKTQSTNNVNDLIFNGNLEFHDLSHSFNNNTLYWLGRGKFDFTKKFAGESASGIWYAANEFCAAEHGGTHLDAPYHFNQDGWTVGQIPFENLITSLLVVDLSNVVAGNNDFVLQRHHMDYLFHLDPKRKHTVIFRFGWSQYYNNETKYFGSNSKDPNRLRFPGITEDVAKWITETSPSLVGVGVDTPSVDLGSDTLYPAHRLFASKNIFMLENVNFENSLPSDKCSLIVMPMKIQDGTGAPVRLTAICPKAIPTIF